MYLSNLLFYFLNSIWKCWIVIHHGDQFGGTPICFSKILVNKKKPTKYVNWFVLLGGFGGLEKGQSCVGWVRRWFNLRTRRGYVPDVSERRQHPWLSQSSSLRAQCRWRHPWWHSRGIPWGLLWFLRRSIRRYAWLHHDEPDDGWQAWWYPGCYLSTPSCDAWRPPFRVPFLLYHGQTFCCFRSNGQNVESTKFPTYIVVARTYVSHLWSAP